MIANVDSAGIDTGTLIELLGNTELGNKFKVQVLEDTNLQNFYLSPITVAELLYLLGRKLGFSKAQQIIGDFIKPFIICEEKELRIEAARLKADHTISLADCYSLSIGIMKIIPVYLKRESEMEEILQKGKLPIDIRFIDDL